MKEEHLINGEMKDKTDVLKIFRAVRGLGSAISRAGEWWLHEFIEACEDKNISKLLLRIATMPKDDLLLATLASLAKWERSARVPNTTWRVLGCGSETCPLCKLFFGAACMCNDCPLVQIGKRCLTNPSPYDIACKGDSTPLIEALHEAVVHVIKEEKERAGK